MLNINIFKRKKNNSLSQRDKSLVNRKENLKKVGAKKSIRKKITRILMLLLLSFFILGCVGIIVGLYFISEFTKDLPDITDPAFMNPINTENSVMYDRNGKQLYKFIGDTNRILIDNVEEIPELLKYAYIVSEDAEFYNHKGVDFTALVRCGFGAVTGGVSCGGSTITQQAIKNSVLLEEAYSLTVDQRQRKIREILLALKLETMYSKDEILRFYFNLAPEGGNVVGVKTAAKQYFGKEMKDITLAEASMLAGIIQDPPRFSPYSTYDDVYCTKEGKLLAKANVVFQMEGEKVLEEGPFKDNTGADVLKVRPYKCRQLYVLEQFNQKMSIVNKNSALLTTEMIDAARVEEIKILPNIESIKAPHFVFYSRDQLLDENSKYINDKPLTMDQLYNSGYKIFTTVDLDLQQQAEGLIKKWVDGSEDWCTLATAECNKQKKGVKERFGLYNASLSAIDAKTGEILTMVGSKDYFGEDEGIDPELGVSKFSPKVNIMTSLQQPGSSIKPIGLLAGFESGKIAPTTVIPDISLKDVFGKGYDPQNAENWTGNGLYFTNGPVNQNNFISYSMKKSLNRPMLLAADSIGVSNVLDMYEKMGYTTFSQNRENYGVAVMIGAGDVYPIEHVNAFATLANGGVDRKPYNAILRIEDSKGKILWKRESEKLGKEVLDSRAAYLMSKMLYKYSELQTQFSDLVSEWPNYGKTGTSDENKDTWYMVYTPNVAVGMWVGNNDNSSPHPEGNQLAYGSNAAMPALEKFLEVLLPKFPKDEIILPPGIVKASVCIVSGKLATEKCGSQVVEGEFIQGKLPPTDDTYTSALVCYDRPISNSEARSKNKIARKIDEQYGYARASNYRYLVALNPLRQEYYDKVIGQTPINKNNLCDNDYSTVTDNPFISIVSPLNAATYIAGSNITLGASSAGVLGGIIDFKVYLDGSVVGSSQNETINQQYKLPTNLSPGLHILTYTATDLGGRSGSNSISINIQAITSSSSSSASGGVQQGDVILSSSTSKVQSGDLQILTAKYTGDLDVGTVSLIVLYPGTTNYVTVGNMVESGSNNFSISWLPPNTKGIYSFRTILTTTGDSPVSVYSNIFNMVVQ